MPAHLTGFIALALAATCAPLSAEPDTLWYPQPAANWEKQALPIGNGRLGGMIFGGVSQERIQFNEDSLWIGDEKDTGAYQNFGDLLIELGQGAPGPGVTNPSGHSTSPGQQVEKSIDGDGKTKWCMEHEGRPVVWQLAYAEAPPQPLREYRFTSAGDVPTRDPQKWRLEASNDGKSWTLLDQVSLDTHFPARHQTKTFQFENDMTFPIYRFVFEIVDKSHFQVAEIALGAPGSGYESGAATVGADAYRRSLDIARGVHRVEYQHDGVTYRRTAFSSRPDQVMVIRLEADKPGSHTGRVSLADAHKAAVTAAGNRVTATGDLDGFVYGGGSSRGRKDGYEQFLDYEAQVLVLPDQGRVEADGDGIKFTNCDALTIFLGAGTNFLNQREKGWKGPHPHQRVTAQLDAAAAKTFDALLQAHVDDFSSLSGRCAIDLGGTAPQILARSTDARLAAYKEGGADPDLEELMFQYARYMMISSSRPGTLPANLQGLWNHSNSPPWRSDYHTDVNIQMNYWFVDAANLAECFSPLADWVHSIRGVRRDETRAAFNTRGWISHAENGPFGGSTWKWSKGDAAWVAQNLWDHYAFTRDEDYLRTRAYPVMKELCEFWEDHLKELPDGTLVSPDGFSPEHGPHEDGVSFDQQLVHDLFTNFIEASELLGEDAAFRAKVAAMRNKLLGPQIGKWGQLQEWMVDRDDPKDQHRHLSHMIAVHPGRQISPLTTPELAAAARVSMNARGDASTGWSRAWKISIWARLHDGDRAYKILNSMLQDMIYENLFNTHPPFQIDGNFGYAAGVCEMLLQSHTPELHILPALPAAWATGSARGLRARGGIEVDLEWKDGALQQAFLTADRDTSIPVRYGETVRQVDLKAGERAVFSP